MSMLSDLDAAMAQPARSVPAARLLGGGAVRTDDSGRPLRAVGRDAVVYELRMPTGRIVALRCHLRPDPQRDHALSERYTALGADPRLEQLHGDNGCLPRGIRWVAEGITLPGPDLRQLTVPIMAMERISGRTLIRTVDRLCHERQSEPLSLLADAWLTTAEALATVEFSHGDFAPDNIIVRSDGTLALIDLDHAHWPGAPMGAAACEGTPGYAHPRGAARNLARRDRFPALIIWASLRVLAHYPDLRDRWGDSPNQHGAALLWSPEDLRRPGGSPLFAALATFNDSRLAPLLEVVRRAVRFPADDTPPLAEIASRLARVDSVISVSSSWLKSDSRTTGATSGDLEETPDSSAPRLSRNPAPFAATTELGSQPLSAGSGSAERDHRLAARQIAAAIASRDTAAAVAIWDESRAIPEVATHAASVHFLVSQDTGASIERALRRNDDEGLVTAVAQAELLGVAPSAEARIALRGARERISARSTLNGLVARNDIRLLAGLAASGKLNCLDRLEPAQARAIQRARAWPALERALASDDDIVIASAADPTLWREQDTLPPPVRDRIELAGLRLRWLDDVRTSLRKRDVSTLRQLLANAPPGAEARLTAVERRRISRVAKREAAVARLERALREGPDREVVAAMAEFETAGAPFSDILDWAAVRGVVDRISLAEALRAAAAADPPDTAQLARLLPAARAALGGQGNPGEPDWAALELAVLRAAHVSRLREALVSGSEARIASAATPDPYDAWRLLTPSEMERVQAVLDANRQRT